MSYPFPKPYRQEPNGPWIVHGEKGIRTFTDPEIAWSTYQFAKLTYEKKHQNETEQER
jgi:hypothetical protein